MSDDFVSNISVEMTFPVRFKVIETEEEFQELSNFARIHRTSHREGLPSGKSCLSITEKFQDSNYGGKTLNQELKDILSHLESKIDILINLVAQDKDAKNEEYPYEGFCQRLSCGEMDITLPEDEKIKDCFGIQVLISPPTLPPVRVNCTGTLEKEGNLYKMAFVGLNTDDREDLLGYLIKRERELLRMRKLQ